MKATTRLRQMLSEPGIILAPGAFDAFSAKLVEAHGFGAVYMTGSGSAAAIGGVPDVGLFTMSDMVENAARLANAVSIPVIADADTGYGNALNVRRTIREYERAGVAAVHLEDQQWPKKCGHFEGKRLIPSEEMVGKIRAAVDARTDSDFLIIARTDAIAVNGFDDAIERGKAYEAAGADVIFVEAPRSREDAEAIGRSFSKPLLFNMAGSGKTPFLPADEVELLGFKIMIFPSDLLRAAAKTMQEVLVHLRETGCNAGILDRMMTFKEYTEFLGLPEIYEAERRYGIT